MPLTFPRVNEVQPGDPLSSRNVAQLADAFNARIRSGLGDAAFRVAFWWLSAFRQLRNPDASRNLWPSNAEALEFYQHLPADVDFPVSEPGDPEGLNLVSTLPWYVYGSAATAKANEADRLTNHEDGGLDVQAVATAEEAWQLGKVQRGAIVPETGAYNAPAFDAARETFGFVRPGITSHGKAYGGYIPTPAVAATPCNPPGGQEATPVSYAVKFTRLDGTATYTYPGTCPDEPTHVAYVLDYPLEYYVVRNSGAVDWYPKSLWIQGPYTGGGQLAKTEGEHLPRIVNRFAGEFRGSEEQVADEEAGVSPWLGRAFNVAAFMARPYYLAPARALTAAADTLTPVYPTGGAGQAGAGQVLGVHTAEPRFWFCAAFVDGSPGTVVEVRGQDDTVIARGSIPASGGLVLTFSEGSATVTLRAATAGSRLRYELAETLAYRPAVHDLFLVLRIAGARLSDGQGTDGCGLTEDRAVDLWAAYSTYGCIPQLREDGFLAGSLETINRNAVFDAARRYSRSVRCIRRQQILGYGVEDGRSILYVDPYAYGTRQADSLAGIRDAIAHEAPEAGWTNEWVGFWQFKGYNPSGTSLWKPDSYSDYFALSDRCLFTHNPLSIGQDLKQHFNAATKAESNMSFAPEVASGFRYASTAAGQHANAAAGLEFYRSCQIYQPPLEIDTAETVRWGGFEVVKITFTGRLQHHPTAPASINPDVSTWDVAALTTESADYRTDENALRDYLAHVADGSHQCEKTGPGNKAASSWLSGTGDDPFGTCYPHLWLVQLIPRPRADGNDDPDAGDTTVTHGQFALMETYLRIMCEGCVDGATSEAHGCQSTISAVYDFTFPNLCFQAFGLTSMGTMPGAVTDYLGPQDVREDNPVGYGPLPTVRVAAETFNRFAKAVNLLTRYRVMFPMELTGTTYQDAGAVRPISARYADGAPVDCTAITTNGFLWEGAGWSHTPSTVISGPGVVASASGELQLAFASSPTYGINCSGTSLQAGVTAREDAYSFEPIDTDAVEAIPETWRDDIALTGEMLAEVEDRRRVVTYTIGTPATTCAGSTWDTGAGELVITVTDAVETECRLVPSTGRAIALPLGAVRIFGADNVGQCDAALFSAAGTLRVITPIGTNTLVHNVPLEEPGAES
jgi:hypothetical protein